jgi:hypothetical protein
MSITFAFFKFEFQNYRVSKTNLKVQNMKLFNEFECFRLIVHIYH